MKRYFSALNGSADASGDCATVRAGRQQASKAANTAGRMRRRRRIEQIKRLLPDLDCGAESQESERIRAECNRRCMDSTLAVVRFGGDRCANRSRPQSPTAQPDAQRNGQQADESKDLQKDLAAIE